MHVYAHITEHMPVRALRTTRRASPRYLILHRSAVMDSKRNGLWGKLKGSYGTVGSAFSSLSLSTSENDGDTESDTVIHGALVRYYQTRDGMIPPWLGVETTSNGSSFDQQAHYYSQGAVPSGAGRGGPTRSHSTALQEMYKRRQQQQEQLKQRQQEQGPGSDASIHSSHSSTTRLQHLQGSSAPTLNRAQTYSGEGDLSSSSQSDRFRNKLRAGGASRANW
jgi:hypothetical protein